MHNLYNRKIIYLLITTRGLQDRNIHILDGTTVENKGKLILTKYIYCFKITKEKQKTHFAIKY